MAGTKTVQKTWGFTPEIISELEVIRLKEMRSQQNMVEVLIHEAYTRMSLGLSREVTQIKDRDCGSDK